MHATANIDIIFCAGLIRQSFLSSLKALIFYSFRIASALATDVTMVRTAYLQAASTFSNPSVLFLFVDSNRCSDILERNQLTTRLILDAVAEHTFSNVDIHFDRAVPT